jgi:hypothetical protein
MGQREGEGVVGVVNGRHWCCVLCAIATMALAGCASAPEQVKVPVEVKIPVPQMVYCEAPKLEKPNLPIAALGADSAPADTIREYAATVAVLKGAVLERDQVIAGCAKPAGDEADAVSTNSQSR